MLEVVLQLISAPAVSPRLAWLRLCPWGTGSAPMALVSALLIPYLRLVFGLLHFAAVQGILAGGWYGFTVGVTDIICTTSLYGRTVGSASCGRSAIGATDQVGSGCGG